MFMHIVKMASAFVMQVFMEQVFEANAFELEVSLRDTSCAVYLNALRGENVCLSITLIYHSPNESHTETHR